MTKRPKLRGEGAREIRRQHIWKFNENPNDPDADPASPWRYVNLQPLETDTRIKTTRDMLAGGIESGLPCVCGTMTRWVQTVTVRRMLEEGGFELRPEHQEKFDTMGVAVFLCPKCERVTQAPLDAARRLRAQYEARRDNNE